MSEDLRVVKTIELIEGTLLNLLKSRDFDTITVSQIVATCRVNRSTFYRNYSDKYDLIDKIMRKKARILIEEFRGSNLLAGEANKEYYPYMEKIIHRAYEQKDVLLLLWKTKLPYSFFDIMFEEFNNAYLVRYSHAEIGRDKQIALYTHILTMQLITTIRWWLTDALEIEEEELLRIMIINSEHGLLHAIEERKAELLRDKI